MLLNTRFDKRDVDGNVIERTEIPDESIESVWYWKIFRITKHVSQYGIKRGSILMYNHKKQQYSIFKSTDHALRGILSTHGGYGYADAASDDGELQRLDEWQAQNRHYVWLLVDWGALKPKQRQQYEERCLQIAGELKSVTNEHKVLIREWMEQASTVIDSLGRQNIGRTRTLQSSAAEHGAKRGGDVVKISFKYDLRKAILLREREQHVSTCRYAETTLAHLIQTLIEAPARKPPQSFYEMCTELQQRLSDCHDRPWFRAFAHCWRDLNTAMNYAQARKIPSARKHLNIAHLRIVAVGRKYEQLAQFRFRQTRAYTRRPRCQDEMEHVFQDLIKLRRSFSGQQELFQTQLMEDVRQTLDGAIAEWNSGELQKSIRYLQQAATPFYTMAP